MRVIARRPSRHAYSANRPEAPFMYLDHPFADLPHLTLPVSRSLYKEPIASVNVGRPWCSAQRRASSGRTPVQNTRQVVSCNAKSNLSSSCASLPGLQYCNGSQAEVASALAIVVMRLAAGHSDLGNVRKMVIRGKSGSLTPHEEEIVRSECHQ